MQNEVPTNPETKKARKRIATHPNPVWAFYGFSKTIEKRFWSKVDKSSSPNGCWLWTGNHTPDGYGMLSRGSLDFKGRFPKMVRANIASWIMHRGHIAEGLCVCHNCPGGDNPRCVNPEHLWIGTRTQNGQDASKKGVFSNRGGENNYRHKLTWEAAEAIRLDNRKTSARKLAKIYGVSRSAIRFVLSGHSWRSSSHCASLTSTDRPKNTRQISEAPTRTDATPRK